MLIKKILAAFFSLSVIAISGFAVNAASNESLDKKNIVAEAATVTTTAKSTSTATGKASGTTVSSASATTTSTTTEPTTAKKYTITFLDFDGNKLTALELEEGSPIDYQSVDTTPLHKHLDINTEKGFSSWDITPEKADKDYTIHALYKVAKIYYKKKPDKYRYFSTKGKVNLDGLQAYIDISVQTPKKNKDGTYIIEDSTLDISSSCVAKPASLSAAFSKSDNASITVYPIGDKKPLFTFDIICYRDLGDANRDGTIDSVDASIVLSIYANIAASKNYKPTDDMKKVSDVNMDSRIDALDASYILKYYAIASTAKDFVDWENILDFDKILKK